MSVRNKQSPVQFWLLRFFLRTTGWRSEPFAKTGGTGQFLPWFFVSTFADPAHFCKSLEKCWPCPWESVCQQTSKCAQLVTKFFRFLRVSRSPHSTWSFTTVSCLGRGCARAAAAMMSKGAVETGGPHHHMAQEMPVDSLASVVVVGWRWGRWRMLQPAPHRQTAAGCWRMLPLAPPLPDGVWDAGRSLGDAGGRFCPPRVDAPPERRRWGCRRMFPPTPSSSCGVGGASGRLHSRHRCQTAQGVSADAPPVLSGTGEHFRPQRWALPSAPLSADTPAHAIVLGRRWRFQRMLPSAPSSLHGAGDAGARSRLCRRFETARGMPVDAHAQAAVFGGVGGAGERFCPHRRALMPAPMLLAAGRDPCGCPRPRRAPARTPSSEGERDAGGRPRLRCSLWKVWGTLANSSARSGGALAPVPLLMDGAGDA